MDSYTLNLLERIEKKLDFIINNTAFNSKDIKDCDSKDQTYFSWYHDFGPASPLDVIE